MDDHGVLRGEVAPHGRGDGGESLGDAVQKAGVYGHMRFEKSIYIQHLKNV